MNAHDRSRFDMLIRVRNFGASHGQLFPENSTAHAAFSIVAAEAAQIEALAVAEQVASRSARATRKLEARAQLEDVLARAVNTARVLSRTIPELAGQTELPIGVSDRRLLTFARAFATAVTPHVAQFAATGIALEGLGGLIEALERAVNERNARRDQLAQTRDRLGESLKRALQAVDTLDVTIANTLASDPVTQAAWKRERRLQARRPRGRAVPAPAVTPAARLEPAAPPASEESAVPETPVAAEDVPIKAA